MENHEQLQERRAYLLDVSLFIFDVLSSEKILRSVARGDAILEVPSAFVSMIWSSLSGDTLLEDLVYAYLVGLRNDGSLSKNPNEQIRRWAVATDEELRSFSQSVLKHILGFYSQLIEGAVRKESGTGSFFPIKRYEPVLPDQSNEDILRMRDAYITEFGIRSHPLYDLYFLQIHHAQSIGIAASPLLPRIFVFLGRQAAEAISRWIGETDPRAINLTTRERYRRTLGWFVNEYIADQFLDMAIDGILNIGVSFIIAGIPGINIMSSISVANLVRKTVIDPIVKSPYLRKETDVPAVLGISFFSFAICIFIFAVWPALRVKIFSEMLQPVPPSPTLTQIVTALDVLTPSLVPTIQIASNITIETASPNQTIVPFVEDSSVPVLPVSDVDYCLYVIQLGDTLQSVATRFRVTEDDLIATNRPIAGTFTANQIIRVNAPCCRVIDGEGFSYTVQKGENLYRIAKGNLIPVDYLASVNNLYDPKYIQAGQMLCIPTP